jgi:hypothetical protein
VSPTELAKSWLCKEEAMATTIFFSALTYFGDELDELETETMRITAARDGLSVPEENWDALFAVLALRNNGRFMWDASVFENTVLTFNDEAVITDVYQQALPAHIAWAVKEAAILTQDLLSGEGLFSDYLDYEPESYTAASCKFEGMLAVPESLSFCEDRLIELIDCSHDKLMSDVKKSWMAIKDAVNDITIQELQDDSELNNQLLQMAGIELYVSKRKALLDEQLRTMKLFV